nr:MAG TPA: hypothetical protein [Caudoviricetes sp.]
MLIIIKIIIYLAILLVITTFLAYICILVTIK